MTEPNPIPEAAGRRRFLVRIIQGVHGVMGATLALVLGRAVVAPAFEGRAPIWLSAGSADALTDQVPRPVTLRVARPDDAPWIAAQVEDQFGAQGSYLLDFYHVCDYLAAAAKAIVTDPTGPKSWLDEQKSRLKMQRGEELIELLQRHLEPSSVDDSAAPVRQCHRYLSQRRAQLDYQRALAQDLSISSGEIEPIFLSYPVGMTNGWEVGRSGGA